MENEVPNNVSPPPNDVSPPPVNDKVKMILFAVLLLGIYVGYKTKGSIITKIIAPFIYGIVLAIILSYTFIRDNNYEIYRIEADGSILFSTLITMDMFAFDSKLSLFLILLFLYLSYTYRGTNLGLFCVFILLYLIYYRVRYSMIMNDLINKNSSNYDKNAYIENVKRVRLLTLIITLIIIYKYIKYYNLFK